jgi:hypothetical protein
MSIVFVFPAEPAPTAPTMNYSVVVLGGILVLSVIYYFFPKYGGVYWFKGPVNTLRDGEDSEGSRGSLEKRPMSTQSTEKV